MRHVIFDVLGRAVCEADVCLPGSVPLSVALDDCPLARLQLGPGGEPVDCAVLDIFHIGPGGTKYATPSDDRQALACAWDDVLIQQAGAWIVRSEDHATIMAAATAVGIGADTPVTLAEWRDMATRVVDLQAGAARETLGTPGYGQTVEYERTEADARAFLAALATDPDADPADYPMLAAELEALEQASGVAGLADAAAVDVAQEILDLAAAWAGALAAIKTLRRGAKLRIEIAADVAQIAAVLEDMSWPGQEE